MKYGPIKGDLVIYENKVFIIELAARLSGGFLCTYDIPLAYGVDFVPLVAKQAVGGVISQSAITATKTQALSIRLIFCENAILRKIEGTEKVLALPGVEELLIWGELDEKYTGPENSGGAIGAVIASGSNRANAIKNSEVAIQTLELVWEYE